MSIRVHVLDTDTGQRSFVPSSGLDVGGVVQKYLTPSTVAQNGIISLSGANAVLNVFETTATGSFDSSIGFNSEADYTQENAANGTDYTSGAFALHNLGTEINAVDIMAGSYKNSSGEVIVSSDSSSYPGWNLFSRNPSGYWMSDSYPGGYVSGSEYMKFKFNKARKINKYSITILYLEREPKGWIIKASNTGTFSGEEVTLDTKSNVSWSATSEKREYSITNNNYYLYYAIFFTQVGSQNWINLTEFEWIQSYSYPAISSQNPYMTSNTQPSGIASASSETSTSYAAYRALDNATNTYWMTTNTVGWLQYQPATPELYTHYSILSSPYSGNLDRIPKTFELWGSNVGNFTGEHTILDSQQNVNWTTEGGRKRFKIANPDYYAYYRLNITANNGNATYLVVYDFRLENTYSYYIETKDASQVDCSTASSITSVTDSGYTIPSGAAIKILVSIDGRSSWLTWGGSSWDTVSPTYVNATDYATFLANIASLNIISANTIDVMVFLSTTDASVTPEINNIEFNFNSANLNFTQLVNGTDWEVNAISDMSASDFEGGNLGLSVKRLKAGSGQMGIVYL